MAVDPPCIAFAFQDPMLQEIITLEQDLRTDLDAVSGPKQAEQFRLTWLSRKGRIATLFDQLKAVPATERPAVGKALNALRVLAEEGLAQREFTPREKRELTPQFDPTLASRRPRIGHAHLVSQTIEDISAIFRELGFQIATGPEIESDYYNFEALNFPADHPARDMQDTFFLTEDKQSLLRTHTTPVQIRVMQEQTPPVRVIMPGRVYRNEAISARSHVQFHQVDGLYVDTHVTFAELKGTLVQFAKRFYGEDLSYRFRASFFPFTEPSAEMDISCYLCRGAGCKVCKQTGWLEILGCGMVDPNVFASVGFDPEQYSGYAFGIGIERTAMLRRGLDDIRLVFENDLRVNHQF